MSKTYLGVDIGGTAVKLGLVDEAGTVLRRARALQFYIVQISHLWILKLAKYTVLIHFFESELFSESEQYTFSIYG